jgi:hypothetical protein
MLEEEAKSDSTGPFCTPRAWTNAATLYGAALSMKDRHLGYQLVGALVGKGASAAFTEYVSKHDLPDPSFVLDNPYSWPARYDLRVTSLLGCMSEAVRRKTKDSLLKAEGLIAHMTTLGAKDLAALALSVLFKNKDKWNGWMPSSTTCREHIEMVNAVGLLSS